MKLILRLLVTAISTRPSAARITAYMAASASAMMVGPDKVPPGRTRRDENGTRAMARSALTLTDSKAVALGHGTPSRDIFFFFFWGWGHGFSPIFRFGHSPPPPPRGGGGGGRGREPT